MSTACAIPQRSHSMHSTPNRAIPAAFRSPSPAPSSSDDKELGGWQVISSPAQQKQDDVFVFSGPFLAAVLRHEQQQMQRHIRIQQPSGSTMPGWKDDYLSSLMEAERNNPVNFDLVEACSHLADRIAALEAEKAQWQSTGSSSISKPPSTPSKPTTTSPSATDPTDTTTTTPRLRHDLALALAQKGQLETRLRHATADRDRLQAAGRTHARAVATLTTERDALRQRVRDQADELRAKKAMLDAVQDDVLALETSLTLVEKQKARLAADNRDLVERWMRRARLEAELMNEANERGEGPS